MKKIICAVYIMVMAFFVPASVFAAPAPEDNSRAMIAQSKIYDGWETDEETYLPIYPDGVGGLFIGTDNYLTVSLSVDDQALKDSVLSLSGDPEIVKFTTASYSYNELLAVLDDINSNWGSLNFSLASCGIIEEENYVGVNVAGGDFETAKAYFAEKYGAKVDVHSGEYVFLDLDEDDDPSETGLLSVYINGGILLLAGGAAAAAIGLARKKRTA